MNKLMLHQVRLTFIKRSISSFNLLSASAVHQTFHPQYQSSLNNLMIVQSPIHRSISPADLSPQQRTRPRSHHHRHSTNQRRIQTQTNAAIPTEQQTSAETNSNNKA